MKKKKKNSNAIKLFFSFFYSTPYLVLNFFLVNFSLIFFLIKLILSICFLKVKENYLKKIKLSRLRKLNQEMSKKCYFEKKKLRLEVIEIIFEFLKVLVEPTMWNYAEFFFWLFKILKNYFFLILFEPFEKARPFASFRKRSSPFTSISNINNLFYKLIVSVNQLQ